MSATSATSDIARQTARYDRLTRLFHWCMVLLVAAQFALGWTMPDVHGTAPPLGLVLLHVNLGVLLLLIAVPRLLWSGARRPIAPVEQHPALAFVANVTHKLLYASLIAVPLLGWLNSNGRTWQVGVGHWLTLPTIAAPHSLGASIGELHSAWATALAILIGLHACAALAHRFFMKDGVLARML
ncbi:cytochrome b [Burkholderia sp. Bp8963]|uniref:cytochrome b n=1 Tax=Burkholderia sp. Bp8963 TaxID=2184547 RepID=UPI000F5A54E7|nr:cytochrome b [Burkholderia sp. Bp8963]RQS74515.1 cytochrome b [Burkholderia sp. Bp8963]